MTDPDGSALFARLLDLRPDRDPAAAVALGDEHWEELRARTPTRHDAETCRVLAISASLVGDYALAEVWRARALVRFAALGWVDGVAVVIVSEALARLARDNDDYANGRTLDVIQPSPAASDILASIEPYVVDDERDDPHPPLSDWSPSPDLTRRLFWEKGGFLLLVLRRFAEARASYAGAAKVARPGRGALKVAAGALLVEYLAGRAGEPADLDAPAVIAEQRRIVDELREVRADDVLEAAEHNLAVMERGGMELRPYEIL